MKTLLSGATIVTCDESEVIHAPGDLVFDGDTIDYVGSAYDGPYDVRLACHGKLLMPGLINAHTHSAMVLLRGLADDVDLMGFLQQRVWPREASLTPHDVYTGSLLAGIEMLKGGVTCYVDMYFMEDALARAALSVGLRALITPAIIDIPGMADRLGSWEQQLNRVLVFVDDWNGIDDRISCGFGPHAPYTLPLEALKAIAVEARRLDVPVNIHLVETAGERDGFKALGAGSTALVLSDTGFFSARTIAAHSVWLDPGDIEIYRDYQVGVAHCPQSNAKLGSGIAPIAALLAAGVAVGLGTDGAATNNNLDLWEEIRLAPLLAKVSALDPRPVTARQALTMATRLGAKAIHMPDVGSLSVGKRADMLLLDAEDTTMVPVFEPSGYISHLAYSAGRELVESVWVGGRQVMKDREVLTVDECEVKRAAQDSAVSLMERALV